MSAQTLVDRARRRIRLRGRLTSGVGRVRVSWWSIGQSALGGALAWELAVRLLGHQAPFFASVAAIVCLSISVLNRLRRVGELALGVSIGVVLGDLLVREIGRGGWQLGLVVLIAMTIGVLFDGGAVIVNQAALQAVFVTVLPPPAGGYVTRWEDALLGGAVALMVAFALPADPRPALRRECDSVILT
ncbi:MAG TPA: FUSC family protein, partial [Kineosporiaceae bacterium]|nr:FUSC family protein [Kineosporiaceae bacterium]